MSPATATEIGSLLKKCCKLFISVCIKKGNQSAKKQAQDFLKLLEEDLPIFINKPAMETRLQQIRRKKTALPSTHAVAKFNEFIEKNVCKYLSKLQAMFTSQDWKELASFTLTAVQLFNRKRAGEIERITIEDFETCHEINDNELDNFLCHNTIPQQITKNM